MDIGPPSRRVEYATGYYQVDENFATEQILAAWVPGQRAVALDAAAYRVPAGADLVLRIAYKEKTWTYEGLAVEDRSALGLYVWERTVPTIEAMALQPAAGAVADADD